MTKAFLKFVGYISVKWAIFYTYQFIESGNKEKWFGHSTNLEGVLLAVFMLLALPLVEIVVLIFPLQLALRQKAWLAILILMISFVAEFVIGWFATNQHLETWMIVKIILSVGLFFLIYRNQLNLWATNKT